jgi:hypothetical protein
VYVNGLGFRILVSIYDTTGNKRSFIGLFKFVGLGEEFAHVVLNPAE